MKAVPVLILWLALVAVGARGILRRQDPPPAPAPACTLTARRALPENYRLSAADAQASAACDSSWVGRYLPCAVAEGGQVPAAGLRPQPVLPADPARAAVLSDAADMVLNAGAVVDLYRDGKLVAGRVPVLAVLCPEGKCSFAVLSLPTSALAAFQASKGPSVYVLRSIP
jgi:hypothetical protein